MQRPELAVVIYKLDDPVVRVTAGTRNDVSRAVTGYALAD